MYTARCKSYIKQVLIYYWVRVYCLLSLSFKWPVIFFVQLLNTLYWIYIMFGLTYVSCPWAWGIFVWYVCMKPESCKLICNKVSNCTTYVCVSECYTTKVLQTIYSNPFMYTMSCNYEFGSMEHNIMFMILLWSCSSWDINLQLDLHNCNIWFHISKFDDGKQTNR